MTCDCPQPRMHHEIEAAEGFVGLVDALDAGRASPG